VSGLLWGIVGVLSGFGLAAIGDMVSEEVRDRLDHLPHAILRLAGRRLDPAKRVLLYEEVWLPDLAYHLRGDEARPVTRLYHGTCFALGMLASAHRSSRNLSSATSQHLGDATSQISIPVLLDASQHGHPGVHASVNGNQVLVTGESDRVTWESFDDVLLALGRLPAPELVLDITGMYFIDVYSMDAVLRFAASLSPPRQLEVRCRLRQGAHLRILLGKRSITQLSINALDVERPHR